MSRDPPSARRSARLQVSNWKEMDKKGCPDSHALVQRCATAGQGRNKIRDLASTTKAPLLSSRMILPTRLCPSLERRFVLDRSCLGSACSVQWHPRAESHLAVNQLARALVEALWESVCARFVTEGSVLFQDARARANPSSDSTAAAGEPV